MMVNVKTAEPDETEMGIIYRALAPSYCVCNHKKDKHVNGEYKCTHKSMELADGRITTYECECQLYESLEHASTLSRTETIKNEEE